MTINVIRLLSTGAVVSSSAFAKLPALKQTEILAQVGGRPVVFVADFKALADRKKLVQRLLTGEDVSMELEFNEITLSKEENDALKTVCPLFARIGVVPVGAYPWLDVGTIEAAKHRLRFTTRTVGNGSYTMGLSSAKTLWVKAAKWVLGGDKPGIYYSSVGGYSDRDVQFDGNAENFTVRVGCQTISRADIEAAAQHFEWEIPS